MAGLVSLKTHNNQIKKEAVCYTPACEWPPAIFSQAFVPQTAPIITGVRSPTPTIAPTPIKVYFLYHDGF